MSMQNLKNRRSGSGIIVDGMNQIKTNDIIGKIVTIRNVDVITTKNGTCGVMIFDEFPNAFYFAGSVLTSLCSDIIAEPNALDEVKKDGCKISIYKATSESTGREYVTYRFVD